MLKFCEVMAVLVFMYGFENWAVNGVDRRVTNSRN
jgi:hypothetical protein